MNYITNFNQEQKYSLINFVFFIVSVVLIFITVQVPTTLRYPDTFDYLHYIDVSIFGKDFYYAKPEGTNFFPRPFTIPLMYKLAGGNIDNIVIMQKIMHVFAAFILSFSICIFLKQMWNKIIITTLIYLLFSTWTMVSWATVPLSESLIMSFLFIWIATFLFLIKYRKIYLLTVHFLVTILFAFTRDSWPYIILIFYMSWLIIAIICDKKLFKYICPLLLGTIVIFFVQNEMSEAGKRYKLPLINSILFRIIPNDSYTEWFVQQGMPYSDSLKVNWAARAPYDQNWLLYRDPQYNDFMNWAGTKGKSTYTKFLITHPAYSLCIPYAEFKKIMTIYDVRYHDGCTPPTGYTKFASWLFPFFSFWLCLALASLCLILFLKNKYFIIYLLPIFLIAFFLANVYLMYNADCFEKERHFFITNILIQLTSIISLGLLLNKPSITYFKKIYHDRIKKSNNCTSGI